MQPDVRLTAALRQWSRVTALLAIAIGATALSGRALDVSALERVLPGAVTVKPNTAIALMLAGGALLIVGEPDRDPRLLRLARAAAVAVVVLGLVTVAEHVFGWSGGFDTPSTRMAPNTAFALGTWAIALLALDTRVRGRHVATGLALLTLVIGFVGFVAYLSGTPGLYGAGGLSQMAASSALGVMLLAAGLLLTHPERAPVRMLAARGAAGSLARRILPGAVVIPVLMGVLRHQGETLDFWTAEVGAWVLVLAIVLITTPLVYALIRSLERSQIARRRVKEALENREAQYRALSENAAVGIVSMDAEDRIAYVNPAAVEMLGWERDELIGRAFTDLLPARDREHYQPTVGETTELVLLNREGLEFEAELSLSEWSEDGVRHVNGIFRDVTAKNREAQRSAARYATTAALVEATTVEEAIPLVLRAVCEALDWRLGAAWMAYGESGALRLHEAWSKDEEVASSFKRASGAHAFRSMEGIPGTVWARQEPRWIVDVSAEDFFKRRILAQGLELRGGMWVPIASAGQTVGVLEFFSAHPEWPDDELLATVSAVATELGLFIERRRAAARARENRALLQTILDNSPTSIHATDTRERLLFANRIYAELLGQPVEEMIGQPISEFLPPSAIEVLRESNARVLAAGEPITYESEVAVDGGPRYFFSTKFPLQNSDGEAMGICTVALDITDRKEAELEIARARDQAIAATRMKSEFLANMSHEIRTPMNGLIGMTELLLESDLAPEQREYAELARTSGETLVALVNDLLDLSKIEAGKVEIDTTDFRLDETVEDVCSLMSSRAHEKGVALSVLIESDLPPAVRGDEVRVRQVLSNLVANAVKFTHHGEVAVTAGVVADSANSVAVCFEVRDTGIGIAPEQVDRLFESFEQADSSTTREYGGTGLGLTIARQLTELMHGEIVVESEPGEGTTFRVTIPFERGELGATAARPDQAGPAESLRGLRVLVADDNATNRRIVSHHAESWGMRASEAGTGNGALERLRGAARGGSPFDVLVADMHMPGLDGLELARAVRADPALNGIRLVLLSSGFDDRRASRSAGFDDYLPKPIRRSRLYEALLGTAAVAAQSSAPRDASAGSAAPILVVEDNDVNQLLVVKMLERRGFHPDVAANGQEALDALAERDYALVLMDCQMPVLDGYAATRAIREREQAGARTPIVAMTAHSMSGDRERCLAAGMDDYVAKPLDAVEFDAVLERWLPDGVAVHGDEPWASGIDQTGFAALRAELDGTGALPRLVELFSEQTPDRLAELRAAVETGDADAVKKVAHTLKGGSASLAATAMAGSCKALQELAEAGSLEGAEQLVLRIEHDFEVAREALTAEVGQEVTQ